MLTEQEARTKWCPFGRTPHFARDVGLQGVVAANRAEQSFEDAVAGIPEKPLATCSCIASDCMAWRGMETSEFNDRTETEFRKTGKRIKSDTGYCGLAGEP